MLESSSIPTAAPHPPAAYQVFISHAVEDKEVAQAICEALERHGIRCWIAPRDILPGKDWAEAITDATDGCRGMVLVYSEHSNASAHVRREVERAVGSGSFLIPFRISDVPMSKALAYFLHSCQWLDANSPPLDKHVSLLVTTVRTLLQKEAPAAAFARLALAGVTAPAAAKGNRRKQIALLAGGVSGSILLVALLALTIWTLGGRGSGVPEANGNSVPPVTQAAAATAAASTAAPPSGKMVSPSEVTLRGGNFMVRSEGFNLRSTQPALAIAHETGDSTAPRAVLMSNRQDATADEVAGGRQASITFQLNNQSHERVTISQVELLLLGIVTVFEDQIAQPQPPIAGKPPADLVVEESDPRQKQDYANLKELFHDRNDPPSELRYSATSAPGSGVGAALDADQKLDLTFGKFGGGGDVTLTATDAFGQSAEVTFRVTVKGPPDPSSPLAVLGVMQSLPDFFPVGQPAQGGVIEAFVVEEKRQDLGEVLLNYSLDRDTLVAPASSGNLLPEDESSALRANSARSAVVRVNSRTALKLQETPKDLMQGVGARRLSAYRPQVAALIQLLALRVRINSEDGARCDLYTDNLYLLHSMPYLAFGAEVPPGRAGLQLLNLGVLTHEETIAFQRGQACGLELAQPGDISEFCFYRNPQHPLRQSAAGNSSGTEPPWLRSNLVPVLAGVQTEHPELWKLLAPPFEEPAAEGGELAKAKAAYLRRSLAQPPGKREMQPTIVQVVR